MTPLSDDDREALTAYLDGELDEEATQRFETRLAAEPVLRAELDAQRKTWSMLDYLPPAAPSADFTHKTLDRIALDAQTTQTAATRRPLRRTAGWLAGAALALAVGYFGARYYRQEWSPPIDADEAVVRDLRLLQRLSAYDAVDDLDFLKALDAPDLFGEEGA